MVVGLNAGKKEIMPTVDLFADRTACKRSNVRLQKHICDYTKSQLGESSLH